ncbi:hypothetical protein ACIOEW_36525 [Streptomyces sp. NPDC087901]|uniref:hypothetical protein n=1 Tax=Streptomyces sp. NPDC087901 TaxID=3365818 RepID=UPI003806A97D
MFVRSVSPSMWSSRSKELPDRRSTALRDQSCLGKHVRFTHPETDPNPEPLPASTYEISLHGSATTVAVQAVEPVPGLHIYRLPEALHGPADATHPWRLGHHSRLALVAASSHDDALRAAREIADMTYGALGWSAAAPIKAVLLCGGMAGAYWLVALVPGPLGVCLVAVGTGVFFAPLLTVAFGMVGELAPEGTVTEAFAWLVTLIGAGIAAGSAVSGLLLADSALAGAAALGACGVTAGAVVLALSRARLARPVRDEAVVGVG